MIVNRLFWSAFYSAKSLSDLTVVKYSGSKGYDMLCSFLHDKNSGMKYLLPIELYFSATFCVSASNKHRVRFLIALDRVSADQDWKEIMVCKISWHTSLRCVFYRWRWFWQLSVTVMRSYLMKLHSVFIRTILRTKCILGIAIQRDLDVDQRANTKSPRNG